jgi:8-oxo-dGTP pyrophosphatase MutT (NUDIX family)/nucleotide-binding universal stress UspA family protein
MNRSGAYLTGVILYGKINGFTILRKEIQDKILNFLKITIKDFIVSSNYATPKSERYFVSFIKGKFSEVIAPLSYFSPRLWNGCFLEFSGDDFLLFVQRDANDSVRYTASKVFIFGLKLQHEIKQGEEKLDLGLTMDYEDNASWCKINNKSYLVGPRISRVSTLMSFSDAGHFFLSDYVHEHLKLEDHGELDLVKLSGMEHFSDYKLKKLWSRDFEKKRYSCNHFSFYDAKKNRYKLYSLYLAAPSIGNSNIPDFRVAIESRDSSREAGDPQQQFNQYLINADKVTLIGITHENTVKYLHSALEQRKKKRQESDLFISYNTREKLLVAELAEKLRKLGIRVWIDSEQIKAGSIVMDEIQSTIKNSRVAAVLLGKEGIGRWEEQEINAIFRLSVSNSLRIIPVLLPNAPEEPKLPLFLQNYSWIDFRSGFNEEGLAKLKEEISEISLKSQKLSENALQGDFFWERLDIIFPSLSTLQKVVDQRNFTDRKESWDNGKWTVTQFLRNQGVAHFDRWSCKEFDGNLPFIGNRFIGKLNKSIRFSPQLPGCDQKESCYIEVFEGMRVYNQLNLSFDLILAKSTTLEEWIIFGKSEPDVREPFFKYHGIVIREEIETVKSRCDFPIIMVVLYTKTYTGIRIVLQERTEYNASSDIQTWSNISGRLTHYDVYPEKEKDIRCGELFHVRDHMFATAVFNKQLDLKKGDILSNDSWIAAAKREIQEELGLTVENDRIGYHRSVYYKRPDGYGLHFRIYSLELKQDMTNELVQIKKARPYAGLHAFSRTDLVKYKEEKKLNKLLDTRFDDVFGKIFQELNIEQ